MVYLDKYGLCFKNSEIKGAIKMYRIKWFIRKLFKKQKAEKPPAEVISVMDLIKPSGEWGGIYEP